MELGSLVDSNSAVGCKTMCCCHLCGYCYRYGGTVRAKGAHERHSKTPDVRGYGGQVA